MGENGKITLTTKEGKNIAQGMKISNHLYKLKMVIRQSSHSSPNVDKSCVNQTFVGSSTLPNWETWH